MSKTTKIICLVAAGMLALGMVMAGIGYFMGGGEHFMMSPWDRDYDDYDSSDWSHMVSGGGTVEPFSEMVLDVDWQVVELKIGNDFSAEYTYDGRDTQMTCTVENEVLTVREDRDESGFRHWFGKRSHGGRLIITYPEGTRFDKVDVKVDLGDITIERLLAGELILDAAMGDVDIYNSECDNADISCELGSLEVDQMKTTQNLQVNMSAGDVDISGDFKGRVEVECEMGDVDMNLAGTKEEYRSTISIELGDASVNGQSVGTKFTTDSGENELIVNSALGDVDVNFR